MNKSRERRQENTEAACILAGGKNSRMHGRKKAFLPVEETVFWKKIAGSLERCGKLYISVEDKAIYEREGETSPENTFEDVSLVEDIKKGKGPLGGIYSVLTACEERAVLFVPCDMPEVSRSMAECLSMHWRKENRPVFFARNGKVCPFPGIYTKEMLPLIRRQIEQGDYKLQNLFVQMEEELILLNPGNMQWDNINTEEEYHLYLKKTERRKSEMQILETDAEKLLEPDLEDILETDRRERKRIKKRIWKERIPVREAVERILKEVQPIREWEELPLLELPGRILWEDVYSRYAQPPFPRSPLDGYAIRSVDSAGADKKDGIFLQVIDTIYAGEVSEKTVGEKQAVRLMTGAPIPAGADTVIRQEDVQEVPDGIYIFQEQRACENYCREGEDYPAHSCLLKRGETIRAAECGLLASMGYSGAKVVRKVRVAVIATGSELIDPGRALEPGRIYNSNLYLVCGRLAELGVSVVWTNTVKDDAEILKFAIEKAQEHRADLILTIGGVSVGEKDIVEETYRLLGADICFHGVQMKPGSPMMGGSYRNIPILSFSGNPYGTFVNMELFVPPLLKKLTGGLCYQPEYREGTLAETFEKTGNMPRFVRARWENGMVRWEGKNASGTLSSLHGCNCLLEIPPGAGEGRRKGENVWVRMLRNL